MEEQLLYEGNPAIIRNHPFFLLFSLIFMVLAAIGLMVKGWNLGWVLTLFGLGGFIILILWLNKISSELTITNKRSILRKGILAKSTVEIFHSDVRTIQIKQTLFQRLLIVGDIGIASAAQSIVEIEMLGASHPEKIRELINKYRAELSPPTTEKKTTD